MRVRQEIGQSQQQRIDPKLILTSSILQLTSIELAQAIEQELVENPALDLPDENPCEACEQPKTFCIDCPIKKAIITSNDANIGIYDAEQTIDFAADIDENENDYLSNIGIQMTLPEFLISQMHDSLPESDWKIGEYLISNINDSGYLECSVEEIALELNENPDKIEEILQVIQTFDPAGVGARNIRECMVMQLKRLDEDGNGNAISLAMIKKYWPDMITGKLSRIARRLNVSIEDVYQASEFIRTALTPYPGNCFRPPFAKDNLQESQKVRPDVIIKRNPMGYEIDITGYDTGFLKLNSRYMEIYEEIKKDPKAKLKEENQHIVSLVERAELFLNSINERRKTLRKITSHLLEYQQGYLETGNKTFLRPITRTKLAQMLDMHESTVSRATSNKYIMLPSDELVDFDLFFNTNNSSIKDAINDLINNEDRNNPLSDQQIADILNERGFQVARRTIVKYREAEKILSSRKRSI